MKWTRTNYEHFFYPFVEHKATGKEFGEIISCYVICFTKTGEIRALVYNTTEEGTTRIFERTYSSLRSAKRGIEGFIKNRHKIEWKKKNEYVYEAAYKDYRFCVPTEKSVRFITVYTEIAGHTFITNMWMKKRKGLKEATKVVENFLERAYKE